MTTFGLIITLLGAGSIAANILRLIDCRMRPNTTQRVRPAACAADSGRV